MNINNLSNQCVILNAPIHNITHWVWPKDDTDTFGIIASDWLHQIEPFLREEFPIKDGVVIQAGGNCGMYPLLYTSFFKNVYTFEPDPLSFFCLVNNCQIPGIIKFNCGLGETHNIGTINAIVPGNCGMNQIEIFEGDVFEQTIPVVPLDSFSFQNVKLIQFDLEGYEPKAIKGAVKTIEKHKPMIILECDYKKVKEVKELMKSIGYKSYKQITRLDTVFIPE